MVENWNLGDAGPIKLKVPPKKCAACGGKFIPASGRQKYCPECRKLSPEEREKVVKKEYNSEVTSYVDESLIRKKPEPAPAQETGHQIKTEVMMEMIRMIEKQFNVRLMVTSCRCS